jgi:hypothetical protein
VSNAGDILAALTTDIEAAVSGITVSLESITFDEMTVGQLPYCTIVQGDYTVETIPYSQEERVWTIAGVVCQNGGTRETMATKLEAIRDQIFADQTLGGVVDVATFAPGVPFSHSDSQHIFGEFGVRCEKVV